MVSNFTNVIARLINGGKRTVNSLYMFILILTMDLFLVYQFGNFDVSKIFVANVRPSFCEWEPIG